MQLKHPRFDQEDQNTMKSKQGRRSRRRGADAERELVRLLRDELGDDVARNLSQSRDGGADLTAVGPFALEVKRVERLELGTWWAQACRQAAEVELAPALAYRQSRQPWRFVVPLDPIMHGCWVLDLTATEWAQACTATVDLQGFAMLVREA